MLVVMSALLFVPGLALPFVGLEVFIGLVQGLIFSLLVLIYFILATESHEEHGETEHALEPHPVEVDMTPAPPRAARPNSAGGHSIYESRMACRRDRRRLRRPRARHRHRPPHLA